MKAIDLVNYCEEHTVDHCDKCPYDNKECDRFFEKFGFTPDFRQRHFPQLRRKKSDYDLTIEL